MPAKSKVVEDFGDPAPSRPPTRWPWLLVGLAAGLSLAMLLLPPRTAAITTSSTAPDTIPSLGAAVANEGMAEQVTGFEQGLVAVRRSEGRSVELFVWPLVGAPYSWNLGLGTTSPLVGFAFDPSGRQLATLIPARGNAESVLFAGTRDVTEVVATGVTGFAWHDGRPLAFAYTTSTDGELTIWVASSGLARAEPLVRSRDVAGRLVAWGDWGFAVQGEGPSDPVVIYDPGGVVTATYQGRVLATRGDGMLLLEDRGLRVIDGIAGDSMIELGERPGIVGAAFSPDGSNLALLTKVGVSVVSLIQPDDVDDYSMRIGFPQISWTSDGRFLLTPAVRGIAIIDTDTGDVYQIAPTDSFVAVAPLPLTDNE